MKRSVFILGAEGFIGSKLAGHLRALGHRVGPDDSGSTRKPRQVEDFSEIVGSYDCIVHAATSSTPSSTAGAPLREVDGNLRTTVSLIEALQARPECRLVYFSSAGTLYGECAEGRVRESSAVAPRSYHGAAKLAAEQFLRALSAQFGTQVVVIRPSNVYGPGQIARPGFGIIPTALACCLQGRPLTIWGDGRNVRDYLYVDDLAELVANVIDSRHEPAFSVVNASAGIGHSLIELVELIRRVSGNSLQLEFQGTRSTDAVRVVPDPSLASDIYGWAPKTNLADGLMKTFEWMLQVHKKSHYRG